MAVAKHTFSIHVDAPVEAVFRYIANPAHFIAAMPANHHASLGAVHRSTDGAVTSFECVYRELGMHVTTVFTREVYQANQRIVDRASVGPVHMFHVEPDAAGTKLTYAWDASSLMKLLDALFENSDKDAQNALTYFKREIEALPPTLTV